MNKIINKIGNVLQLLLAAPIKLPGKALNIARYIALGLGIIETVINQNDDGLGAGGEADPDNQLDNAKQSTVEAIHNDKEKKDLVQQKGAKDETQ